MTRKEISKIIKENVTLKIAIERLHLSSQSKQMMKTFDENLNLITLTSQTKTNK